MNEIALRAWGEAGLNLMRRCTVAVYENKHMMDIAERQSAVSDDSAPCIESTERSRVKP